MQNQCINCHVDDKQIEFHESSHQNTGMEKRTTEERYCVDCHKEHRGRNVRLADISDRLCRDCHDIRNVERDHPPFDPGKMEPVDMKQIGLNFSHKTHRINEKYVDKVNRQFEKECLLCHNLDPDQGYLDFKPIDFDTGCKDCHPQQELTLTKIFGIEAAQEISGTIHTLVENFGVESFESFLSRFEFKKGNKRRRRPSAFKYVPVHKDPYIKFWFSKEGVGAKQVQAVLGQGRKGVKLNCLKCHVADLENTAQRREESTIDCLKKSLLKEDVGVDQARAILEKCHDTGKENTVETQQLELAQSVSLLPALPRTESFTNKRFPHKKHARQLCRDCHETIDESESLVDLNQAVKKKQCFNCHNNQVVENRCTRCHLFHKKPDPAKLTTLMSSGLLSDSSIRHE